VLLNACGVREGEDPKKMASPNERGYKEGNLYFGIVFIPDLGCPGLELSRGGNGGNCPENKEWL
jgi:hypothetical protein